MTRVYLAVSLDTERTALHFLLMELGLEVIGEAADWSTTLTQAPIRQADMLLVDWNLLPDPANLALENARAACPSALIIVLVSHQDATGFPNPQPLPVSPSSRRECRWP